MWGRFFGLLHEMSAPAFFLVALVIAALAGYWTALLRSILKEIRGIKAEIHDVKTQVREDRKVNKSDHDRLFDKVSTLEADVKVLRDRSDRPSGSGGSGAES